MDPELDIARRSGLPEHLRVLADRYPRALWRGHDNFSELTAFWLERHLMFRDLLDRITALSETQIDAPNDRFGAELSRYTGFFLNQLHGHHTIEDTHYFPKLTAFDKRLARGFDMLDADHHALEGHLHGLADHTNAVLSRLNTGASARDAMGALHGVQQEFATFLNRHLVDEEEIIVPLILEYGPEIEI